MVELPIKHLDFPVRKLLVYQKGNYNNGDIITFINNHCNHHYNHHYNHYDSH